MNEHEWLAAVDPVPLLGSPRLPGSRRKERLILVACARHAFAKADDRVRAAINFAERLADGLVSNDDCAATADQLPAATISDPRGFRAEALGYLIARLHPSPGFIPTPHWARDRFAEALATFRMIGFEFHNRTAARLAWEREIDRSQAEVMREVFGNPFRSFVFDPEWRTSDVLALARGIYDGRVFDRMPILAGALQDAGCPERHDLLTHCRDVGAAHVRGCWALDLVLSRE
jgi:hypothetical protein